MSRFPRPPRLPPGSLLFVRPIIRGDFETEVKIQMTWDCVRGDSVPFRGRIILRVWNKEFEDTLNPLEIVYIFIVILLHNMCQQCMTHRIMYFYTPLPRIKLVGWQDEEIHIDFVILSLTLFLLSHPCPLAQIGSSGIGDASCLLLILQIS